MCCDRALRLGVVLVPEVVDDLRQVERQHHRAVDHRDARGGIDEAARRVWRRLPRGLAAVTGGIAEPEVPGFRGEMVPAPDHGDVLGAAEIFDERVDHERNVHADPYGSAST